MSKIIYHALNRSYDGSQNIGGEKEHVEHYEIAFDEPPTSEVPCYADVRSPRFSDVHVDDKESFVSNLEASTVDGVKFDLAVTYTRIRLQDRNANPLAKPAVITGRSQQRNSLAVRDFHGNVTFNTAGVAFGAREVQRSLIIMSVAKKLKPKPWPGWLLSMRDVVNQSSVKIKGITWPKRTLRMDNIFIGDDDEENDTPFILVTFDITFDPKGWRTVLLNEGVLELREFVGVDLTSLKEITMHEHVKIIDGTPRQPIKDPVFLDKDGKAYREKDGSTLRAKLTNKEIIKLEVQDYQEVPFNILPLK